MLRRDRGGVAVQGLEPRTVITVVSGILWTPGGNDTAFCVSSDCTYLINGTGLPGTLYQGDVRVIREKTGYIFDTTMNIEVM